MDEIVVLDALSTVVFACLTGGLLLKSDSAAFNNGDTERDRLKCISAEPEGNRGN